MSLYKHIETEEATPGEPLSVNIQLYDDETVTDDDPAIDYHAPLVGIDGETGGITYDEIEKLFHIDPDKPMWQIDTYNSTFDDNDAEQCLTGMATEE
ncbi:hypothetical protein [Ktedonospora formicarum]|uniref:hypothetical protein n=1 Tax=Ktedonospora formicarum TaxID=2778364 RepID=UPI001C690AA5|nr:hypothetical protein [Ktedonospora formicarum]